MKQSFFALGIALSLSFAACNKADMPGPSADKNRSERSQSSNGKKPAEQLRIRSDRSVSILCIPQEQPVHQEPVHVSDTTFTMPRTHSEAGIVPQDELYRGERFPREASK